MNLFTAPEPAQLTPGSLTDLESCSEASVYAPGYIQAHGLLLSLQQPDLKILQVSENVEQFWGISATALINQPLQRLFSRAQVRSIQARLLDNIEQHHPFPLKARLKTRLEPGSRIDCDLASTDSPQAAYRLQLFRATLHQTPNQLILELEPQAAADLPSITFHHRLQAAILSLREASHSIDLVQILAQRVKAITEFDRVMVYRFEADNHGIVIAEAKVEHLDSYLGLHYPATDIPAPARQLFLRNWVRQISDVNGATAQIIAAEPELDLSSCILRGVSPYHIQYLQNMGVASSLTISLIADQQLWGLIACHHSQPRLISYETRIICEFLGQFASIELAHQRERELSHYRSQVKLIQDRLQQAFIQTPDLIQQILVQNAEQLLELVHATGVAIVLDQQIALIGQTPTLEDVQAIVAWLIQRKQHELYTTNCLVRDYPPAAQFKHKASGILAVSVMLHQKAYQLIWFRPELIQTVNWAGDPRTAVSVDATGEQHLIPRRSFELWKETVQDTSSTWQPAEIEAALLMRNTLMLAILEFSQAALERAAERATIANRAKSQFLAKMSHELRTPLNAILGFAQMMNRDVSTSAEFQEYIGIINRSGEHLLALINDVLEMSRIEAGQLVLTPSYFNLDQLLRSLQDMFALKAAQKGLLLRFESDTTVPHYGCSDEAKLRQILINLIGNAIKFTTEGRVTVAVKAQPTTLTKDCPCYPQASVCQVLELVFEVEDTGCGIDRDDWDAVFEAFMQTDQGRQEQGTGLGLSISRQFARLLGGDITVCSRINQGSRFTCSVMLHQPQSTDRIELETVHSVVGLQPGQPAYRILVVEDVFENRQLLRTLLESIGFEVRTAENGLEALEQWQTWQPNLIFMDIQMPMLDGHKATQQIRAWETERTPPTSPPNSIATTKIIALTAYAFEDDRTASLTAGCDDHITKPFSETAVFEVIARHLKVEYCYGERTPPEPIIEQRLTAEALSIMSADWILQMHEAALDLNDQRLLQLISQIPLEAKPLIDSLNDLVNNFQLEAIANLTRL